MTAEAIGVRSSAAAVRPASTRRTLAMSRRFAVELEPKAIVEQRDDRGRVWAGGDRRSAGQDHLDRQQDSARAR